MIFKDNEIPCHLISEWINKILARPIYYSKAIPKGLGRISGEIKESTNPPRILYTPVKSTDVCFQGLIRKKYRLYTI